MAEKLEAGHEETCARCQKQKYVMYKDDKGKICADCYHVLYDTETLSKRYPNEKEREKVIKAARKEK